MITDLYINPERKALYYEKGWWTEDTIGDVWNKQVAALNDTVYVSDDTGSTLTYAQVDDAAARLAAWLDEMGVQPGDVVTFQLPTWAEFCIVYVACLKVGAVMHPLPIAFNEKDLEFGMNLVESVAFICPTFYHHTDYEAQAHLVESCVPTLKCIALMDKQGPKKTDLPTVAEIIADHEPLTRRPAITADDVACILSTSGTTGKPKAALFTHNNILFSERSFTAGLGLSADDVMFMPSPLNHATGFYHGLISPMLLGGRTVLQQHFDAEEAVNIMNAQHATWSMGATPFIYDILNYLESTGSTVDTLRLFLCGGAPVPGSMVQRAHASNILLCEVYGSTESCPHIFVPPTKCLEWNGAWSGISPNEGIEVAVVDEEGNRVPAGVQGEEISRGPHQFVGYLNNPESTARALKNDWFFSGDLCYMDETGRVRINGRKKEIIIRGGENISANEIDAHLLECPGVGDHATIGMPDDRLGERICTFLVPSGEKRPTLEDITEYLESQHVQKRLWPERIEYIDAIPYTATGKIRRFVLTEELLKRLEADND